MNIAVTRDKCVRCGTCVGSCPKNAIFLDRKLEFNFACNECGLCVKACPVGALHEI